MATNRPASSKPAGKKKTASATAKTPATKPKAPPKTRAGTATIKTAKPGQGKLTPEAKETGKPRAPRKVSAKKGITAEERYLMVERAAYFLAERHGFSSGRALDDWIAAEKEIDSMLKSAA
ncbi:MAG TPA: DUF2934 domain-containing protein [Gallionellaceae bacterium]